MNQSGPDFAGSSRTILCREDEKVCGVPKPLRPAMGHQEEGKRSPLASSFSAPTRLVMKASTKGPTESKRDAKVREPSPAWDLLSLRVWGGPAPFFQSQRLKVGRSATRWVFVVTTIVDSFRCVVWSRWHTTHTSQGTGGSPDKSL